jgi:nucleotide-binding universal stress UspA family protein
MARILLAVDESENARRAARYLAKLASELNALDVHVLNVRVPVIEHGELSLLLPRERAEQAAREVGQQAVGAIEALLREQSMRCTTEVLLGDVAPSIARRAKELACDAIVIGSRGMTPLQNLVIGSVAIRVVHLSEVPVIVVK